MTIIVSFFQAGEEVELATWMTVSSKVTLHGSHAYFLSLTAEKLGAYFWSHLTSLCKKEESNQGQKYILLPYLERVITIKAFFKMLLLMWYGNYIFSIICINTLPTSVVCW